MTWEHQKIFVVVLLSHQEVTLYRKCKIVDLPISPYLPQKYSIPGTFNSPPFNNSGRTFKSPLHQKNYIIQGVSSLSPLLLLGVSTQLTTQHLTHHHHKKNKERISNQAGEKKKKKKNQLNNFQQQKQTAQKHEKKSNSQSMFVHFFRGWGGVEPHIHTQMHPYLCTAQHWPVGLKLIPLSIC